MPARLAFAVIEHTVALTPLDNCIKYDPKGDLTLNVIPANQRE